MTIACWLFDQTQEPHEKKQNKKAQENEARAKMFGGLVEVRPLPLAGFLLGVYVAAWFIQAALMDYRIAKRGGGGVKAPRVASNMITGMSFPSFFFFFFFHFFFFCADFCQRKRT